MNAKRAIVVGATSGIGLAVAKLLAARGWQVGIAGRRQALLEEIQAREAGIVATEVIDVTQPDAPERLGRLIGAVGGMDLYFHSAGVGFQNPQLNEEKELAIAATNVCGCTRLVLAAFKYFEARPGQAGHIAVISSIAGTKGLGVAPAYSASKRYVSHYLESLTQLAGMKHLRRLTITDIRPGFVDTDFLGGNHRYPMLMDAGRTARHILRGLERRRTVLTIDWKYRLLVLFWRLIPRCVWVRMRIEAR
ncbi:MAG: SDR family NAD(P)-dependent oxidoreductase [Alloprevotella sp.]